MISTNEEIIEACTPGIESFKISSALNQNYILTLQVQAIRENGEEEIIGEYSCNFLEYIKKANIGPFRIIDNTNFDLDDKDHILDQVQFSLSYALEDLRKYIEK